MRCTAMPGKRAPSRGKRAFSTTLRPAGPTLTKRGGDDRASAAPRPRDRHDGGGGRPVPDDRADLPGGDRRAGRPAARGSAVVRLGREIPLAELAGAQPAL